MKRLPFCRFESHQAWLAKQNILSSNPATDTELPKLPRQLPGATLSAEEVERIMQLPDTDSLTEYGRRYIKAAGIDKPGACHIFRHTMATLMHDSGADIRTLQAILGHEKLDTTQIYTRVGIKKLIDTHRHTHPAEQHGSQHDSSEHYKADEDSSQPPSTDSEK